MLSYLVVECVALDIYKDNSGCTTMKQFPCPSFLANLIKRVNKYKMVVHCEGSAPMIIEALMNMTVVAGDSVRFECTASGAPRPSVTWSRGDWLWTVLLYFLLLLIVLLSLSPPISIVVNSCLSDGYT